jgi:hypothetical protein
MTLHLQEDCTEDNLTSSDLPPHVAICGDVYNGGKVYVVCEKIIILRELRFWEALQLFFCLFYNFDIQYPQVKNRPVSYFVFIQKVLYELDSGKLSAKITSFLNSIASQ